MGAGRGKRGGKKGFADVGEKRRKEEKGHLVTAGADDQKDRDQQQKRREERREEKGVFGIEGDQRLCTGGRRKRKAATPLCRWKDGPPLYLGRRNKGKKSSNYSTLFPPFSGGCRLKL